MKVTAERLPESQVRLEIISDDAEFATAMDKASKRLAQRVTVPGFRRGKAPRTLVERHVGRAMIVDEANNTLMDDLYRQALEQEDLTPVTRPSVEMLAAEPLSFRVEVEIAPTADVTGYENVRVEPEHIAVTDQDVDEHIGRLREDNSPWVDPPSPRPVQEGDEVVVDIAAFEGDEPFDEPTTGATFVLGRDNLLPQIRDLIVGATVGEPVERLVTFPEANSEEDERPIPETLLGKALTYHLTVQSAKERELLPLEDELAASLGGRAMTLAELRAEVRS
ncbi:MAG: trigger factor, partial [Thermomicrobia bacterium]|nr:trigger factor [Thermomicrobia bacterium]